MQTKASPHKVMNIVRLRGLKGLGGLGRVGGFRSLGSGPSNLQVERESEFTGCRDECCGATGGGEEGWR